MQAGGHQAAARVTIFRDHGDHAIAANHTCWVRVEPPGGHLMAIAIRSLSLDSSTARVTLSNAVTNQTLITSVINENDPLVAEFEMYDGLMITLTTLRQLTRNITNVNIIVTSFLEKDGN